MEKSYVLNLKDHKFHDLYVCFCGYSECEPKHSYGHAARANYIIHFILEGKGIYRTENHTYELSAGQGFLIEPEMLTWYQADQENPWSYIWIGFGGKEAKNCLDDIGVSETQPVFHSEHGAELKRIVLKMLRTQPGPASSYYQIQSLFYSFLALLSENPVTDKEQQTKESMYINNAICFIRKNYQNKIQVTDIANEICVSRSYLYKLFERSFDMSPQNFLIRYRISKAKELLGVSNMTIENIAASCGFYDARAFSKSFRQHYGVSPKEYRNQEKKDTKEKKETFFHLSET